MCDAHSCRLGRPLRAAVLGVSISLLLPACGGGGASGIVSPTPATPPPTTPPGDLGFTPNVPNDTSIVVNPPSVPTLSAAASLPQYSRHLQLTNAAGALGAGLTGQGVTIGLVDSGVNRSHPALAGRVSKLFIHVNPNTNNTSVDDVVGHGTVVAQMAAGQGMGNWGGGVAQGATIASSRIIADKRPTDDGSGAGNEIHAGEGYGEFFRSINAELADAGAKIINNSWGGLYWNDPALTYELATAWRDFVVNRGGIVVFASGNSGEDSRYAGNPSDNARLPTLAGDVLLEKGWLTVGALDPDNPTQLTAYSQQCGTAMYYCLVAPGNVVFIDPKATTADASYSLYQGGGTSYAAPQVAGAAAVVWSAFPYFTNDQVRQALLGAAKDLGAPGVDPVFGWGLLDVTRAAMGPSQFAWGDFNAAVTGNSVWRNEITGSGGLIKRGSGNLTLTERGSYAGLTRVESGGLALRKGLAGDLSILSGGTAWGFGGFGGQVTNSGRFLVGASVPTSIAGNFSQSATGTLGVWLGNALSVTGSATLNGTVSILGVKGGYTTTAKETLLTAQGGVNGTFTSINAASNVFLDAALAYDPNTVFLNINRIDVSKAVAALGFDGITLMSAGRVESAMQAIDDQLGGAAPAGIGEAFIEAAGALQRATSADMAATSLRSLSGELHAASAAMTLDAIEAGRRNLVARVATLAHPETPAGGWYRNLASDGALPTDGGNAMGLESVGEVVGNDWRLGNDALLGVSMQRMAQSGWLSAAADHARGQQRELQLYGVLWRGPWQAQVQLADGRFQRQMLRTLQLGEQQDIVATRLAGDYRSAYAELGRRFEAGDLAWTPYIGSRFVRISNDDFVETGATGFGLRAHAWDVSRWQALAGVRAGRAWRVGGLLLQADARAEWQRTLQAEGELFDASFTGLEQWAPLQGMGLGPRTQVLGVGLGAGLGPNAGLRFDLSRQQGSLGQSGMATVLGWWRW